MKESATMDLSIIHKNQGEVVGMQARLTTNFQNHVYKINEAFQETDVKGNNNKISSVKTEMNNDLCSYSPTSPVQDVIRKSEMGMDNSIFNYSSFKKAMDLRIRTPDTELIKKTIFEDADYFSKNYLYKLLPITFENVDESIIHTEHNYCHFSMGSESETEEDCSRTMDYSQIKEKNYKKRKVRLSQFTSSNKSGGSECEEEMETNGDGLCGTEEEDCFEMMEPDNSINSECFEEDCFEEEAMDLSAPLVQEEKTDNRLREHEPRLVNTLEPGKEDGSEFDSDKENLKSNLKLIEVTITRPDEKENYQPCDLFLNDIARLVPRLIGKDCFEIDILDRTCDRYFDIDKHRLYYVISASTWRLFQSTKERVILTNDQSLGQPVQKSGRDERPTFLVFDQFSLAKCLADYCKEIGGCFEYTCVEESKESAEVESKKGEEEKEETVGEKTGEERDEEVKTKDVEEKVSEEALNDEKEVEKVSEEESNDLKEVEKISVVESNDAKELEEKSIDKQSSDISQETEKKEDEKVEEQTEVGSEVSKDLNGVSEEVAKEPKRGKQTKPDKTEAIKKGPGKKKTGKKRKVKKKKIVKKYAAPKSKVKTPGESSKAGGKDSKSDQVPDVSHMRTRSKSTSRGDHDPKPPASQKSDKPKAIERRGRKRKLETREGKVGESSKKSSKKLKKVQVSVSERKTRSGSKSSEKEKPSSERSEGNNSEEPGRRGRKRKQEEKEDKKEAGPTLRSRAPTRSGAEKVQKVVKGLSRVKKK